MRNTVTTQSRRAGFSPGLFILVCAPAVPYLFFFLVGLIQHHSISYFKNVSRTWQGALGGGFTLEAAIIGAYFILQQIKRDDRADAEIQERQLQAELAVLPMILSDLIDYLDASARFTLKLLNEVDADGPAEQPPPPSRLDRAIVEQIRSLIEGGDAELTLAARTLLKKLQILGARLTSLSRSHGFPGYMPPSRWTVLGVLADAAELHAIVEGLFPFARDQLDPAGHPIRPSAAISLEAIQGSAWKMLFATPDVEGLKEQINLRFRHLASNPAAQGNGTEMMEHDTGPNQPPSATTPMAMAPSAGETKGWRKWFRDGLGDEKPVAKEFAIRMVFTAAFWLAAAFLANMFDGKKLAAPGLMPALIGFFKEQIDLSMVLFQLLVLGLVALPALFFARPWQREIKREAFRLYYTMSAVGGALSTVVPHLGRAFFFYGVGMVIPWLFVRLSVIDLD